MSTTALIILGMQTGMSLSDPEALDACANNIYKYTLHLRQYNVSIFFVLLYFFPGFPEISPSNLTYANVKANPSFCQPIQSKIWTFDGDVTVKATRLDAFIGSTLEMTLRIKGIENLIFCGYATEGSIISTVTHANALDFKCIILRDLCLSQNSASHQSLMGFILPKYGKVLTSYDLAKELVETRGYPRRVIPNPPSPPNTQLAMISDSSQSKLKSKGKQDENIRVAAMIRAANSSDESAEGALMTRETSSFQESSQLASAEIPVRRGHRGQITGSDEEQPLTGSLSKTKEHNGNMIHIKTEESPIEVDEVNESRIKLRVEEPQFTHAPIGLGARLRHIEQIKHSQMPVAQIPTHARLHPFESTSSIDSDTPIIQRMEPQRRPLEQEFTLPEFPPKYSNAEQESFTNPIKSTASSSTPQLASQSPEWTAAGRSSTILLPPIDYILRREPCVRDRAMAGLEQIGRQTQEEFCDAPKGKRDYNASFLSWQPVTHIGHISGPVAGSFDDERLFRSSQRSVSNEEPIPKRRKSDETERSSESQQGKDKQYIQATFCPESAVDGMSTEMQNPGDFLASALKDKMKVGCLKSHLTSILNKETPDVKNSQQCQNQQCRGLGQLEDEMATARPSTSQGEATDNHNPMSTSSLSPKDDLTAARPSSSNENPCPRLLSNHRQNMK